ncbi:MAG: hypothetical protein JW839_22285 [Candidatus Lokiarchaeota archaeon]|nr:hypothetical protein [Candidatus Lokiarchaeota archaeon]
MALLPFNPGTGSEVRAIAAGESGKWAVTGGEDNIFTVWDVELRKKVSTPGVVHEGWILAVATSPDEKIIASTGTDGVIHLTYERPDEVGAGAPSELRGHLGYVNALLFSRHMKAQESNALYSCSSDTSIIKWNLNTGEPLKVFGTRREPGRVKPGDFKREEDEPAGKGVPRGETGHVNSVYCIDLSHDGRFLVSGSNDNSVHLWDAHTGVVLDRAVELPGDVLTAKFTASSNYLLVGMSDGSVHKHALKNTEASPRGRKRADAPLWIGTEEGTDLVSRRYARAPIRKILVEPENENFFITLSGKNTVQIWDMHTMTIMGDVDTTPLNTYGREDEDGNVKFSSPAEANKVDYINDICITSDGRFILIATNGIRECDGDLPGLYSTRFPGYCQHLYKQLENLKDLDNEFYTRILGENLKGQINLLAENKDSIDQVFKRLFPEKKLPDDHCYKMGHLYSPEIVRKFSEIIDRSRPKGRAKAPTAYYNALEQLQKYVQGVKTYPVAYWKGLRALYTGVPSFPWTLDVFYARYEGGPDFERIEMRDEEFKLVLKDRTRNSLSFKLEIDIPLMFLPLIKAISCQMETDRGDLEHLVFADFSYNPSTRKIEDWTTVKIDTGYRIRPYAMLTLKNFELVYEDSLIKNFEDAGASVVGDYIHAIKLNFKEPVLPAIKLQVGKKTAELSKLIEVLMPKLVVINTIQTVVATVAALAPGFFWPVVTYGAIGVIILILIFQFLYNRSQK